MCARRPSSLHHARPIPGDPKKGNGEVSVHCELKLSYSLTSLDKASSAKEFCGSPLIRVSFVATKETTDQRASPKTPSWTGHFPDTLFFAHRSQKSSEI